MNSISELRTRLVDNLFSNGESVVYTFADKENFSFIDLAVAEDEVRAFRVVITELAPIFEEEEKAANRIAKYIGLI